MHGAVDAQNAKHGEKILLSGGHPMSEPTLDEQVAEALGHEVTIILGDCWINTNADHPKKRKFTPSTNGQQAMDLLRELLKNYSVVHLDVDAVNCKLGLDHKTTLDTIRVFGPTPEIAICRAIVASKATDKTLEQIRQNDL